MSKAICFSTSRTSTSESVLDNTVLVDVIVANKYEGKLELAFESGLGVNLGGDIEACDRSRCALLNERTSALIIAMWDASCGMWTSSLHVFSCHSTLFFQVTKRSCGTQLCT